MKLAVNFSYEVEKLFKDGVVHVDLFKCPDFSQDLVFYAEETIPCYIHFGLDAGSGQMQQVNWEAINDLRKHTDTPFVNVHAVAYAKDYPNVDVLTNDTEHIQQIIQDTIDDIELLATKVGMENIIIENVICRGKGENMMKAIIEPDILSEIVRSTGCGLLLDIAHAQMTSMCLNFEVKEYISKLPVDHLKELHITGIQPDQTGRLRDSMPMTEEDWELAKWAIQNIKGGVWPEPWVVAFEYGGVGPKMEWRTDEKILAEQLPILYNIVKS